jgi:hypothetical protein
VLQVQDQQVVQFASMLGVSMETRDLNSALLASCALMVFPLRASLAAQCESLCLQGSLTGRRLPQETPAGSAGAPAGQSVQRKEYAAHGAAHAVPASATPRSLESHAGAISYSDQSRAFFA